MVYDRWCDLQFRQNVNVVRTSDLFETFRIIKDLYKLYDTKLQHEFEERLIANVP